MKLVQSKMDFSELPYELQFKFLSNLTDQEVFFYCRANKKTWQIWHTPAFWEARAQRIYGISLSHVDASSYFERYQELTRMENEEPCLILILAIVNESFEQIPRYFQKASLLTFENETLEYKPLLSMLLIQLVEEGSKELLTVLLKSMREQIGPEHSYHLQIITEKASDLARKQNRPDLIELLNPPSELTLTQLVL